MKETLAAKIIYAIIEDLCDRGGLQNAWEDIDGETKKEIIEEWTTQINKILTAQQS